MLESLRAEDGNILFHVLIDTEGRFLASSKYMFSFFRISIECQLKRMRLTWPYMNVHGCKAKSMSTKVKVPLSFLHVLYIFFLLLLRPTC